MKICGQDITIDSILYVSNTGPLIPEKVRVYDQYNMGDNYIASTNRFIYFNDLPVYLDSDGNFTIPEMPEGIYQVYYEVANATSQTREIEVVNPWNRLVTTNIPSTLPHNTTTEFGEVGFLNNNRIYTMVFDHDSGNHFYELNLTSGIWTRKSDPPLPYGETSSFNETYGYYFDENALLRYHFETDTWDQLASLNSETSLSPFTITSFVSGDQFFVFSNLMVGYKYEEGSSWSKLDFDYNLDNNSQVISIPSGDIVYLIHEEQVFVFDPSDNTLTQAGDIERNNPFLFTIQQGVSHNNRLYMVDNDHFKVINETDLSLHDIIELPGGTNFSNILLFDGTYIYFLLGESIWSFNLEKL